MKRRITAVWRRIAQAYREAHWPDPEPDRGWQVLEGLSPRPVNGPVMRKEAGR